MHATTANASGTGFQRRLTLLLTTAVLAAAPAVVCAQGEQGPREAPAQAAARPAEAERPKDDGRRTVGRLPANLGRTVVGVFHIDNLGPLVVGAGAAGMFSTWDVRVRNSAQSSALATSNVGPTVETAAGPIWSSVFVASMFTAGRIAHETRFRAMTYDMADAAIVNFAYTELIKVTVRRERPNGQDNQSFPSGHTSNAFALASVAERHYGWKIGVPAYLLAGVVGASRIGQDKHYLSDVVAGATLGYIVGRTTVRVNNRPLEGATRAARLDVAPIAGRGLRGVRVALSF